MSNRYLTIGYHGCDADVAARLLNKQDKIRFSRKPFDWLGHGMYFWENNLERGREWAEMKRKCGQIDKPAVIGAFLDLRNCCDFSDKYYLDMYSVYYEDTYSFYKSTGRQMPVNFAPRGTLLKDEVSRNRDCAVIEFMHEEMEGMYSLGITRNLDYSTQPFDSVRGVFQEGYPVFKGSGICRDTHIQICIRNPACILGFFMPRENEDYIDAMEVREMPALFG